MGAVDFSDLITFTRASGGGRFNSQGQYEWLPANQPRLDYDPVTGECLGLLIEEQRTNLLTYSSDFANAVWSFFNGAKVVSTDPDSAYGQCTRLYLGSETTNDGSRLQRTFTAGAGKSYSGYVLLRSDTPMTVRVGWSSSNSTLYTQASLTEQWTKVLIPMRTNGPGESLWYLRIANVSGNAGEVLAAGIQVEEGSFPTSYIPTTTAQVTRAADIASVNELSPWFNASEGTLFVECSSFGSNNQFAADLYSDTSNRMGLLLGTGTSPALFVFKGAVIQASLNAGALTGNVRMAFSYKQDDFAFSRNASPVAVDMAGTPPAVTRLAIGSRSGVADRFNGHIRSIRFYPKALPDQLQAMTA